MDKLFKQVKLGNKFTLKNSIVMAPMTTWASNDDYTVSNEEISYYKVRNMGAGMIITGCAHVQENGIGFTNEFANYDDSFIPGLKKLADSLKHNGAKAILQINHAGNKALPQLISNSDVISASSVETLATAFAPSLTPRELNEEEIYDVIKAFGQATRRAIEAGFDGVEIHGAHGFLIQNFVSPFFNKRTDKWGGSLENRLRFPIELVKEVKRVIDEYADRPFILGYRVSPDEPMDGALRMTDTNVLIKELIGLDIDYIHASLLDAVNSQPIDAVGEETYLNVISKVVDDRIPLIVAGSLQTPNQVDYILKNGAALAALGHAFVTEPQWVEKVESGRSDELRLTIKKSDMKDLNLPEKLWNFIQMSDGWFNIEE
ncbi:NADH-dependent flavin oxidoreductase [Lacrimispora sp. 38-1]|uniref:NADH-dependent flavin oxidoreductase n=1 Tax=Lacrimispora sp. 38-1 TaxID=3125778 RepID=UPI003CF11536